MMLWASIPYWYSCKPSFSWSSTFQGFRNDIVSRTVFWFKNLSFLHFVSSLSSEEIIILFVVRKVVKLVTKYEKSSWGLSFMDFGGRFWHQNRFCHQCCHWNHHGCVFTWDTIWINRQWINIRSKLDENSSKIHWFPKWDRPSTLIKDPQMSPRL